METWARACLGRRHVQDVPEHPWEGGQPAGTGGAVGASVSTHFGHSLSWSLYQEGTLRSWDTSGLWLRP